MYRVLLSIFAAVTITTSASAQLPPGMKPFERTKIADGVYTFRYFFHRNIFIVTDAGVIATDPLNPRAAKIMRAEIAKVTDQPVEYVVSAARKTERDPDKIRKLVKLPKYETWGGYKAWLGMNVERINFLFHMGK